MSQTQIAQALARLFAADGRASVVFWNDADGEFLGALEALDLAGVQILRMDQTPALRAKIILEKENPNGQWLVYAPFPEPDPTHDWLLDIRLRSKTFRADSASILLDELGLTTQSLRGYIKTRGKFLRARDRVERLKRWVDAGDSADDIDRKMIGTLVRADAAEISSILLRLFSAMATDGRGDLDVIPKVFQEIVANELEEPFWTMIEKAFGYREDKPSLRDLLFRILVTDFARSVSQTPAQLAHFVLRPGAQSANASVFTSRWRSDMASCNSYNTLSATVAQLLRLGELIAPMSAESLSESQTFEEIERRIIKDLKDRVIAGKGANMESVRSLIARRRDGYWANPRLTHGSEVTQALSAGYDALEAAASFFELQARHTAGFSFSEAATGFAAYKSLLFQFDQLYRRFMRAAEIVEPTGWALLHELRDRIEAGYSGWFLPQMTSAWGKVLEGPDGLLANWKIEGAINQQDFFERAATRVLDEGAKRLFVIISDAFRYEAAEELVRDLNSKSRVKATLEVMLGVLPSYTGLGMAALLPHKSLAYKANSNLDLKVDGLVTSTVEQRSAVLSAHQGVAIKSEDLMALGKEKGREFVRPCRLVYIYHDRIDLIGDKQGSETKTFEAVSDAITELAQLASFIINSLNGSVILITADHGFLYQESAMEEADRSVLDDKPAGAIKAKKRYLLGQALGPSAKAWVGNTEKTAGTEPGAGSMDFWIPKGATRFHFAGGARFVHGSAMPQEIVVPLITVRESETDQARTRQVDISLLGSTHKVVTLKQRFEFIQTEAVSERVLPRTVTVSLRDGENPISDKQTLTFDSVGQNLDERKRSTILTVAPGTHDPAKEYFLVVQDIHTKVEILRVPFKLDIAFNNDF